MAQSEGGHQDVRAILLLRYTQQGGSNTQQTERGDEGDGGKDGQQEKNAELTEVRSIGAI